MLLAEAMLQALRTSPLSFLGSVVAIASLTALAGCSSADDSSTSDAGARDAAPTDAGTTADTGTIADTGTTPDANTTSDGAPGDGGAVHDGATPPSDASSTQDGAESTDAGLCATCSGGTACVADVSSGGAVIRPDDAGACPSGRVLSGDGGADSLCVAAPVYHCEVLPGACFPTNKPAPTPCACDQAICAPGSMCSFPGAWAPVQCTELVP